MAVKWSDNAAFPQATVITDADSLMGLQGGANTEFPMGLIANHIDPAKQYIAYINQAYPDPPVATVIKNTLGGTPVFARLDVGIYTMTLAGVFPAGKVFIPNGVDRPIINFASPSIKIIQVYRSSDDVISFLTWRGNIGSGVLGDSILSDLDLMILVFP